MWKISAQGHEGQLFVELLFIVIKNSVYLINRKVEM